MDPQDENNLERLLRAAGKREVPPADVTEEMRRALHAEWAGMLSERRAKRRRWVTLAAAASVAAVAAVTWSAREQLAGSSRPFGRVERLTGDARIDRGWLRSASPVTNGMAVHADDEVATGLSGGVALALEDGTRVRLDAATQVEITDSSEIQVLKGTVYVDASRHATSPVPVLNIQTPLGSVRHLGTQYQVRVSTGTVQVSVREGRVRLTGLDGIARTAGSGEGLTLDSAGTLGRFSIAPTAADWQWAAALAVPFPIDNRPVAEFLTWAARELGRELQYDGEKSAAEARRTLMRGSISDLTPDAALAAVLATTNLRSTDDGARLLITIDPR